MIDEKARAAGIDAMKKAANDGIRMQLPFEYMADAYIKAYESTRGESVMPDMGDASARKDEERTLGMNGNNASRSCATSPASVTEPVDDYLLLDIISLVALFMNGEVGHER